MRHSRQDHHLVKAYAEANSIHVRTARSHRKANNAAWQSFIHARASTADLALPDHAVPDLGKLTPEGEEEAASRNLCTLQAMVDAATARKDIAALPGLLRAAHDAAKLLAQLRTATIEHNLATGRVVDREKATGGMLRRIGVLKDLLLSLPDRVAHLANPTEPQLALWILSEEVDRILMEVANVAEVIEATGGGGAGLAPAAALQIEQVDSSEKHHD